MRGSYSTEIPTKFEETSNETKLHDYENKQVGINMTQFLCLECLEWLQDGLSAMHYCMLSHEVHSS